MPRIRGKAVPIGARWGWEIIVTMAPDRHIANLPAVNGQLIEMQDSMNIKSPEEFTTKEEALRDLEQHAKNIQGMIGEVLEKAGLKSVEAKAKPSRKSTMNELVVELEKIEPKTPDLEQIIREAKAGEYHDYKNRKYTCGKMAVIGFLHTAAQTHPSVEGKAALLKLRQQVMDGDFDEEADEDDLNEMRRTTPKNLWPVLGL